LHAVGLAPADDVGGVVELGAAGGVGEDTGLVRLEDTLIGLDGDGDNLGLDGVHHGG